MSTTTKAEPKKPAIDLSKLSAAELEAALKEKKAAEREEEARKRKEYEQAREELINELGGFALNLVGQMLDLKYSAFNQLIAFRERMLEYGDLRRGEKNKGSFEIKNDTFKIIFTSQVNKRFDERAELAEKKLRSFMESFIRKRDQKSYKIIKALLERNAKTGDYDIDLINRLYTMEDTFDHPDWKDALRLFKESYSPNGTAQYVRFFKKETSSNSWIPIVLDLAKLNTSNYAAASNEKTTQA